MPSISWHRGVAEQSHSGEADTACASLPESLPSLLVFAVLADCHLAGVRCALQCEIMVMVYDEDFEEWVLLNKLEDLPDKAKVQIKRKEE